MAIKDSEVIETFGHLTFNKKAMYKYLDQPTREKLSKAIDFGEELDKSIADQVAHALKEWSIMLGATHFTHWFQPQRGATAEKHDAFLSFAGNGEVIERFSGQQLVQGEPDASSFPSGGMRTTFEARGYTAWDPSSPAFVIQEGVSKTLVIPSVFLSFHGEVLDLKTPLLRSLSVVEKRALKLMKLLGNRTVKNVNVTIGPEQEYFVIDKGYYYKRPDLALADRTLIGRLPAKHQQMEDHYFGSIKTRVLNYMHELDMACFAQGIPAKTRHNEVSPSQFEIAPIFENANIAIDHNLQLMDIMKNLAEKHDFVILFHEKPYAGINGSGKHINWSMSDSNGKNLLEPGLSPKKNIQFLLFLSAFLYGINKHGAAIRLSIADAGNDHRLGANEAPPAIMSVFLGSFLENLLNEIEKGDQSISDGTEDIDIGLKQLPNVKTDNTDRNRTSPIAFTGNKFEVRAAGSSQNISFPTAALNIAMAEGLDFIIEKLETQVATRQPNTEQIKSAALEIIRALIPQTRKIRFAGNNYSDDWKKEAESRGLPHFHNTPAALHHFTDPDFVAIHEKYGILTKEELLARQEIQAHAYIETKRIELDVLHTMVETQIIPAIIKQINATGQAASHLAAHGVSNSILTNKLKSYNETLEAIVKNTQAVETVLDKEFDLSLEHAIYLGKEGTAALENLRIACDQAEGFVEAGIWPFPTYQEMLFRI